MPESPDPKARVLLAEDSTTVGITVQALMAADGVAVTVVKDGREALALAMELAFDLVMLDVLMPELDGIEVCKALRQNPRYQHVPIVMLTSLDSQEEANKGFESGATDYITKPFAPSMLRARVRSWLAIRKV
jgi:two-component system cell cycle response regulator